jgi:hypothetical protein
VSARRLSTNFSITRDSPMKHQPKFTHYTHPVLGPFAYLGYTTVHDRAASARGLVSNGSTQVAA